MTDGTDDVWVTELDSVTTTIEHRNGVKWMDAPAPPEGHEHVAQSRRISLESGAFYRCACGAGRYLDGDWMLLEAPRVGTP